MLKYFIRLLLLIAVIIGIIALFGMMLPRNYDFSSRIEIDAPAEKVFAKINSLRDWQDWSRQWNPVAIDGLEITYNAVPEGVGAAQSWTDPRGEGKLWITESVPNQRIAYDMTFWNFPKMASSIELSGDENKTVVEWNSKGRLPSSPFYGFFGAIYSTQMRNEYDMSLEKLKQVVESE